MRAIWKFPLAVTGRQSVAMPSGARVLCVQTQREQPCLWAEVTTENACVNRYFAVIGTGHPMNAINDVRTYIGSFQLAGGELIFHVYELAELE